MRNMDKLRNRLYDEYKPKIQMVPELQINDGITENYYPFVATKKVTQMRIPHNITVPQDSQPEVLPIEQKNKELPVPSLPRVGPVVRIHPETDSLVYVMKSPLMPWIRAKVYTYIIFIL